SSTISTRTSASVCSPALTISLMTGCPHHAAARSLMKRDRHRAPAPGHGVRKTREPKVDRITLDGCPRVGSDAFAVPGNRQARPEGNDRGIDGNDADADRETRGRMTG